MTTTQDTVNELPPQESPGDSDGDGDDGDEETPVGTGGSSTGGAIFNFTNSILGAGAIALGGAMAKSGGVVSVLLVIFFGYLTKLSLDMVIELSDGVSFEELGTRTYGRAGWTTVVTSKLLYSFGSLVAYAVIIKDTFASALEHLLYGGGEHSYHVIGDKNLMTIVLSVVVLLPLSLLRDMTPLASLSLVSVLTMLGVMGIVMYIFIANPDHVQYHEGSLYEHWFQVRVGVVESLGTFVFTFVSQHMCHLTYSSLRPQVRNLSTWKTVSAWSIFISGLVSLGIGLSVYATFWNDAESDMFALYPAWPIIDIGKLLVCFMMLLTFPLPLFTCREMIVVVARTMWALLTIDEQEQQQLQQQDEQVEPSFEDALQEPLLEPDEEEGETEEMQQPGEDQLPSWLLSESQLTLPYHVLVTVFFWGLTTVLAIVAPSLGSVLDLVGCATGTVIAFVLPGAFSFKKNGFSTQAALILVVGGLVGLVGTYFSLVNIIREY